MFEKIKSISATPNKKARDVTADALLYIFHLHTFGENVILAF